MDGYMDRYMDASMDRSFRSRLRAAVAAAVAVVAAVVVLAAVPGAAAAQQRSVADIRAELALLSRQVGEIREALVATGPARGLPQSPATALQRVDQLDEALRRLTDRVDVLANDLERVVRDASNRVDDIEFRLTELEGGDTSLVGRGEPLGGGLSGGGLSGRGLPGGSSAGGGSAGGGSGGPAGGASGALAGAAPAGVPSGVPTVPPVAAITDPAAAPGVAARPGFPPATAPAAGGAQLAVGERADFEAARAAYHNGRHGEAVRLAEAFLVSYPVGPFAADAQAIKADALAAQGDWRGAARAYLDAFSGAPDAPVAPRALHGLAVSLGRLGQTAEACLTLAEVDIRYPGSAVASDVAQTRRSIGCR